VTGWLEIVVIAFVTQLAVLPGEKVQYIIAGLSTRYSPVLVVSAAGLAFAGWTALEILIGQALQAALFPTILNILTGCLFLLFAVLLYRSIPEKDNPADVARQTDGGVAGIAPTIDAPTVFGRDLSESFGGFVPIFLLMAAGEFGDKTQLVTIGLAAQYGATSAIWVGEMLAIILVSFANAFFFIDSPIGSISGRRISSVWRCLLSSRSTHSLQCSQGSHSVGRSLKPSQVSPENSSDPPRRSPLNKSESGVFFDFFGFVAGFVLFVDTVEPLFVSIESETVFLPTVHRHP
jgi:putative Ca2+/H+ antiporter (TMEM165/GDT1 family)